MIFRLDGGVENVLALTPVLAEWKARAGEPVRVETRFPELLRLNPCVDEAAVVLGLPEERHVELNYVRWPLMVKSVVVTYAERVLGDLDMRSWRTTMPSSSEETAEAEAMMPDRRVAAVCFDRCEMPGETRARVEEAVMAAGYELMDVGEIGSLRMRRAVISLADVFVGSDGPTAALAYTTDVPAAVLFTWRDQCYFRPFRRGVPFAALAPSEEECSMARICLANNGLSEFGRVHGCGCSVEPRFACRRVGFAGMVSRALGEMSLAV